MDEPAVADDGRPVLEGVFRRVRAQAISAQWSPPACLELARPVFNRL
jgi:hypothetical protein